MKPLDVNDLKCLEEQLKVAVDDDRKYWRVNDVKCDAIHTAKTYEEFSDRVAAAHLRPLSKTDKLTVSNCKTVWNKHADKKNTSEDQ